MQSGRVRHRAGSRNLIMAHSAQGIPRPVVRSITLGGAHRRTPTWFPNRQQARAMTLPADARRVLTQETVLNTVISGILAALITWLIFRGQEDIPLLGGPESGAFGIVPGTFMFSAVVTLALSLIMRGRINKGSVTRLPARQPALAEKAAARAGIPARHRSRPDHVAPPRAGNAAAVVGARPIQHLVQRPAGVLRRVLRRADTDRRAGCDSAIAVALNARTAAAPVSAVTGRASRVQ